MTVSRPINEQFIVDGAMVNSIVSRAINMEYRSMWSLRLEAAETTHAAKGFVDGDVIVAADTVTEVGHGYVTGLKGALTTSGVLPAGLTATDYFLIVVDVDTYKFATTLANALAGTAVDITAAAGGGTHTFTPSTLAGSLQVQYSDKAKPDETVASTDWTSEGSAITVTGATTGNQVDDVAPYQWVRVKYTPTSGDGVLDGWITAK